LKKEISIVETGIFGAHMEISMVANGPITIVMDSDVLRRKGK
jgi:D-Tyr-tRNAtyr deacylase